MRKEIRHISYNGELIPQDQFRVNADNRGFLYGDGLFETIRSKGVTIPFFELHMDRMFAGMALLKMDPSFTREHIYQSIHALIQRDLLFFALRIRLTIHRKPGGLYAPSHNDVDYLIQASPLESPRFELNRKGLLVDIFYEHPIPSSKIWNFKVGSALPYVMGGIFKTEHVLDDCLLVNERGAIVEGIASNLFLVKKDTLFTPSLSTGCVDGILRRVIFQIAEKQKLIIIEVENITKEFLLDADELFLTNAIHGIRWIMGCQERRFNFTFAKKLISPLNKMANL